MNEKLTPRSAAAAALVAASALSEHASAPRFRYKLECVKPDGTVRWA